MKAKLEDMPKDNLITIVRAIQKELSKGNELCRMELIKNKDVYENNFYWNDLPQEKTR